ncbi:MAG TPA: DUF6291 domain-containing protein [Draconibacterium sp.]|nr:DUF6291 domain-containing protein [Draconibacterium sp.]
MKQSFLIYLSDYNAIKDELTFEEKGILFDAICKYNFNDTIDELPLSVKIAFKFMKSHFDRDSEKYDAICDRNKNNGKKGGRPKQNPDEPKKPSGLFGNPDEPKKPDNDNDNDNVNVNEDDNVKSPNGGCENSMDLSHINPKIDYQEIINLFHVTCKSFPIVQKLTDPRKGKIKTRINEFRKLFPEVAYLSILKELFEKTELSDFMRGDNKNGWKASFDWIFENGKNWVKIYEGNYDNNKNNGNKSTDKPAGISNPDDYAKPAKR